MCQIISTGDVILSLTSVCYVAQLCACACTSLVTTVNVVQSGAGMLYLQVLHLPPGHTEAR